MTGKTQTNKSRVYETRKLFDIILLILILSGTLISTLLQNFPAFAVAQVRGAAQSNCPVGAIPDTQSILAVLLDRSGSLVAGSEPTDPDGYSGSATKALADVWPGQFAVIPFFGNDQAPKLGPYAHSDVNGINSIKHYIDNNPPDPNANTPLRAAMEQAKTLFRNGIPACSKIVLITDGVPDVPGTPQQEVNTIESQEISWFHNHGIPISVLGLKIDKSTSDGQLADGLLNAIESKTGAGSTYQHVQNAEDLATDVIGLYATWRA